MGGPRWLRIGLRVSPPHQDLIIGILAPLGFQGFLQEDSSVNCFLEKSKWTDRFQGIFRHLLTEFRKEFPGTDPVYTTTTFPHENWNSRWEDSIGIMEATRKIVIKPSWRKLRKKDRGKTVLQIDPKMSFGTGHHETTRLCLVMLEQYIQRGMRVLDVGSGTGIIAIAAAKLGAKRVIALDNDAWSISNARENIRKNRVQPAVKVVRGDLQNLSYKGFDMIICNFDFMAVLKFLPALLEKLRATGILILSGILAGDLSQLMDSLNQSGAIPIEFTEENEWVALALVKAHEN